MKKIFALVLAAIMLASMAPVFAPETTIPNDGPLTTGAYVPPGSGSPPIIKAKWEAHDFDPNVIDTLDDDPLEPGTQILPPMSYLGTVTVEYCVVVYDPDGKGNIVGAYVDVYHPDGTFKYQVTLDEIPTDTPANRQAAANLVQAAYDNGILVINTGAGYDLTDVKDELLQNSAKLYCGKRDLTYHQMCGECIGDCDDIGYTDFPYKVDAYGVDVENSGRVYFTNYFEYICTAGILKDFNSLDWEQIRVAPYRDDPELNKKWIEGDWVWDLDTVSMGPACKGDQGGINCRPPTIRNIGNTPVYIDIAYDDMEFGQASGLWNVRFDASMKHNEEVLIDPVSAHSPDDCSDFNPDPATMTRLPAGGIEPEPYGETKYSVLDLCHTEKISFSIQVFKATPDTTYTGCSLIEPIPMTFPWWAD